LRRRLAYELQVCACGGLRPDVRRRFSKFHKAFAADPNYTPQASQRLKPGTILKREWKGITHQLAFWEDGFEYSGGHYPSLSEISRVNSTANDVTEVSWRSQLRHGQISRWLRGALMGGLGSEPNG